MEQKREIVFPSFSFSADLFGPKPVVDWKCLNCQKPTTDRCLSCNQAFCSKACSAGGYQHHRSCIVIFSTHSTEPQPNSRLNEYEEWKKPPVAQQRPGPRPPTNRRGGGLAQSRIDRIRQEAVEEEELERANQKNNPQCSPGDSNEKKNSSYSGNPHTANESRPLNRDSESKRGCFSGSRGRGNSNRSPLVRDKEP